MHGLTILNPRTVRTEQANGGDSAQAQLTIGPYEQDALVLVSASGSSAYVGPGANAGLILAIRVDDEEVASDHTFEGESFNMTYRSAASHTFVLRCGQHSTVEARVDKHGAGNTTNSSVRLRCYALALAPGHHDADLV